MNGLTKGILVGCGTFSALAFIAVIALGVWLFSGPESGVKLGNEMDQYALDYIAANNLLNPDEELLAYYDATMSMDGKEAAILTADRVVYHNQGNTTEILIKDIEDISHSYQSLIGDVIIIQSVSGQVMKIEIAPLNLGETFNQILMSTWKKQQSKAAGD